MKRSIFLLLALFLAPVASWSQLLDNFEDGDLTGNPAWHGQTDRFAVANGELRLQAPAAENTAFLFVSAPTSLAQNTVWSIKARLDFAPSASNFAVVYLVASQPDLTADQEGYYLRIGGISGADDAIELYRQDEKERTLLISGTAGSVGAAPAVAGIQVRRSAAGEWELLTDYTGGENYQSEGSAQDATYPEGAYAGIVCTYTSTRNDDFYFDDFRIDPVGSDERPPAPVGVDVRSPSELLLILDEAVQPGPALTPANYFVSGGIGQPAGVAFEAGSFTQLRLTLARPLTDQTSYTLTVSNLTDYAGNAAAAQIDFDYFDILPPGPGDLLVNELLFNPQTGGADFLELYNPSGKVLDLDGLRLVNNQISSSNREKEIRGRTLLFPGQYLAVTPDPEDILARYIVPDAGRLLDNPLPSLNDDQGNISLFLQEVLIDSFYYEESLHSASTVSADGVSLERISFSEATNDPANWHSAAPAGGFATPGYANTPFAYFPMQPAGPGDLLLNEILFNPQTGGRDFLELYNPSDHILNLNGLRLLNTRIASSNREKRIQRRTPLFPGEYIVLTPDPDDLLTRYNVPDPGRLTAADLPTLEDKDGNITLIARGVPIDSFYYAEDFHSPFLARRDGVSLERISFNAPTNDPGAWHSAASSVGFATPGYENSQLVDRPSVLNDLIEIPNPRLSPDGDGFEDVLLIQYETPGPGYVLNLRIFDAQGRLVNYLVRNQALAAAGTYQWDGFTNEYTKARIGIYVLWFELFDASGKVEERKETVVVAGKL